MDEAVGTPVRERGWRKLIPALAAFLVLPVMPPLSLLLPVEQSLVLIVPAIAACALVGWRAGGRLSVALFWLVVALYVLGQPSPPDAREFDSLVRGWSLVLAAAFGAVCVLSAHRTFFVRAISAIGLAGMVGLVAASTSPAGVGVTATTLGGEFARRGEHWTRQAELQAKSDDPISNALRARGLGDELGKVQRLASQDTAVSLMPALLALQSLSALALAWGLYHRFSRVRIGLPLAPLREFRFNDQLVWGLIAGIAFVLVETLSGLRAPGFNMLLFFGTLYALRGMGVLAWFLAPDRLVMVPLVLFAVLAFPLFGAVALGLGLGDTRLDWRSRAARPAA